jgi:hypothetical protein
MSLTFYTVFNILFHFRSILFRKDFTPAPSWPSVFLAHHFQLASPLLCSPTFHHPNHFPSPKTLSANPLSFRLPSITPPLLLEKLPLPSDTRPSLYPNQSIPFCLPSPQRFSLLVLPTTVPWPICPPFHLPWSVSEMAPPSSPHLHPKHPFCLSLWRTDYRHYSVLDHERFCRRSLPHPPLPQLSIKPPPSYSPT